MKVELKTVTSPSEEQALIRAMNITEDIQSAIDILSNECRVIPVIRSNRNFECEDIPAEKENIMCPTDMIYYIESVDKRTYVYTKDECYETRSRLYELENVLNHNFFRAAKAMILNVRKIRSVKSEINGRMTAELLNGEKVIIARGYVKDLKEKLGM